MDRYGRATAISQVDIWLERVTAFRRSAWVGYAVGIALFAVGLLVRLALAERLEGFPFLSFFPAIIVTALVGGVWPAVLVTALAALAADYYFIPPLQSWSLTPTAFGGLAFFVLVALINIVLIELLNEALYRGREDRRRAEALLAGREAMFKELQHRVANNMQFLSGLLAMQKRAVDGTPAADALEQASARLRAMSRIHRRLYDPANAERPFGALVEELCHELLEATGARNIVCSVDIPPIQLSPDRVHALSMIATEAMTNAVKHAFADGRPGTISIRLERTAEGELTFIVDDDGPGPPAQIDIANSKSLGMKIMQALAQQLDGAFTFGQGPRGAELRLRFRQA